LSSTLNGSGRVLLTASDAVEQSFEELRTNESKSESTFTKHLVNGLRTGAADLDHDGYVGVDELYEYVYKEVTDERPYQRPKKWTWDVDGRLVIAQSSQTRVSQLPTEIRDALMSPLSDVRLAAVSMLARFATNSDSQLVGDAYTELTKLAYDDSQRVQNA